ncbi:MAG: hypothetical protein LBB56_08520 [Chitinispirillales bacterium]|jgi:hypothetical protein|nr:hypothetical protein [Chitinispirillales bacterium]
MLYTELLKLTDDQTTYEQYLDIEAVYMSKDDTTKKVNETIDLSKTAEQTQQKPPVPPKVPLESTPRKSHDIDL